MVDFIKIFDINEPRFNQVDDYSFQWHSKMISHQVEDLENFVLDEVIKAIPKDVTQLVVIDRNKVKEIVLKATPKKYVHIPHLREYGYRCPICDYAVEYDYCGHCGQAIDWSEDEQNIKC